MSTIKKRLLSMAMLITACCAVVGGLVWQYRQELAQQEAKQSAQRLLTVDKARLAELTLRTPTATFVAHRTGTGHEAWQLSAPLATPADSTVLDAMVQAALDLRNTARVGQAPDSDQAKANAVPPAELGLFGLAPARYSLELKTQDGAAQTLLVGKKNAYDGSLYVKRDDIADLAMVSGDFAYQLDQDLFKLREKRPAVFAAEDVVKLQVVPAQGSGYTLERGEQGLALTAPLHAAADAAASTQVLEALSGLRAKHFAAESATTPQALHPFGLDKPSYTAVVQLKDQRVITLLFGELSLGGEGHTFVMEQGEHPVLELGSDWAIKKLGMDAHALRDLHVLAFQPPAVEELTLAHGSQTLTFALTRDKKIGTETWRATAPVQAPVQSAKISALLYKLSNLRADSVAHESPSAADVTARGLDDAELRIDLRGAGGESLGSVVFGALDGDGSDKRFVTTDKHARIDRVASSAVEDISTQLADYQESAADKIN